MIIIKVERQHIDKNLGECEQCHKTMPGRKVEVPQPEPGTVCNCEHKNLTLYREGVYICGFCKKQRV